MKLVCKLHSLSGKLKRAVSKNLQLINVTSYEHWLFRNIAYI
jgi:hypothetical protein